MKRASRPEPDSAISPETAVWLLYAGLVQGMRWRRHLAHAPRPDLPAIAPPRTRSLARASR